jgi:hypothetical protein
MRAGPALSAERCAALAAAVDLDLNALGICEACLSFVSVPLAEGDDAGARRAARRMAPDLWHEGLEAPLLDSLRRACDDAVPDADAALAEVVASGPRTRVVHAIVLRLAGDQAARIRPRSALEDAGPRRSEPVRAALD